MTKAQKSISDILTACGCKPAPVGDNAVKVNVPKITKKSCDTCARRNECKKEIGIIWGFCNTDYKPQKEANA